MYGTGVTYTPHKIDCEFDNDERIDNITIAGTE